MRMEEKWEKTRRGKQRTRYPRDVARCDVGEMSFLERVDGRERVWNRTKKPAGAEALSRWKKTSVTAPAASTTYSFFFLQFLLQLLQLLLPEFSSFPSFPLLLIVVYSYFLHFHLHLDLPPHCSFSTMLLPVRVFLPYFCYSLVSFIFFSVRYFILLFFPLFSFLFFFFSWSFDPFSSVFHFHFWLLLLSTSTYTFFDSRFTSLLLAHPAVRIAVIKSRRSLSMFA